MSEVIKMFMDDDGNEVPEEKATRLNIVEYDDQGNRVKEVFMVRNPEDKKPYEEDEPVKDLRYFLEHPEEIDDSRLEPIDIFLSHYDLNSYHHSYSGEGLRTNEAETPMEESSLLDKEKEKQIEDVFVENTLDGGMRTWPGWTCIRKIGEGNFGTVYEIQRDVFGTIEKAALKVISIPQSQSEISELIEDGYDQASIAERYRSYLKDLVKEYSLMAELKGNSNVVNCDDLQYIPHDNGVGWDILIKMELLSPLSSTLQNTIHDEQVIQIGKDICNALVLCQNHNIVHRDIKPQNIFVSKEGVYKLGDFGIAKVVESTTTGTKTGTYKYMAPEVYNNKPYGPSADIYSLGMVLYWLLNERRTPFLPLPGKVPTATNEEEAKQRRFSGEPLPAPAHGSDELKRIVLKACAYDPKNRYQSAEEMLTALNKLDGQAWGSPARISSAQEPEQTDDEETVAVWGIDARTPKTNEEFTQAGEETISDYKQVEPPQAVAESEEDDTIGALSTPAHETEQSKTGTPDSDQRKKRKKVKRKRVLILGSVIALAVVLGVILLKSMSTPGSPAKEDVDYTISDSDEQDNDPENSQEANEEQELAKEDEDNEAIDSDEQDNSPEDSQEAYAEQELEKEDEDNEAFDSNEQDNNPGNSQETSEELVLAKGVEEYITFGSYEQDNNTSNGKEAIEWLVLAREGNQMLVISRYALDCQAYNTSNTSVTWETCSLRTWLNGTFINNAFNSDEQAMIRSTTVTADKNPSYSTFPGNNTTDRVFLLSIAEANKYFSSDGARQCQATAYAKSQGVNSYDSDVLCPWWLRSPGQRENEAAHVEYEGLVGDSGYFVLNANQAVRPALWIDTDSETITNEEQELAKEDEDNEAIDSDKQENNPENSQETISVQELAKAQAGDYVTFGSYEQDNNIYNGKEDIEWLVLAREGNQVLVISRYALDCEAYNYSLKSVTWETCDLRTWLNGTFINNAFSSDEQAMIRSTTVTADKNPSYSTSPGNNTTDQVFLLSIEEANKYFGSDSARRCQATEYVKRYNTPVHDNVYYWWLRSPGYVAMYAVFVLNDGSVDYYGNYVNSGNFAVRPALWIDLES